MSYWMVRLITVLQIFYIVSKVNPSDATKWTEALETLFNKLKKEGEDSGSRIKLFDEGRKLYNIIITLTSWNNEFNVQDVVDELRSAVEYLHFHSSVHSDWDFHQFRNRIEKKLLIEPVHWDIFFRIGNIYGFKEGYRIVKGRLYSFEKIPQNLKKIILMEIPSSTTTEKKWFEKDDEYKKRRLEEWYVHIKVKAIGKNKAVERAVVEVTKIISVMKFFRFFRIHTFDQVDSSFDYHILKNSIVVSGMTFNRDKHDFIDFVKPLDTFISKINRLSPSTNKNNLDNRILDSIYIFGNIDNNTPISLRFILCIIALETLLIGNESGAKSSLLAERIAFLLGDTKDWYLALYGINPLKVLRGYQLESSFTKSRLKEARQTLYNNVLNLYKNRSSFTHSGISDESLIDDYLFSSSILLSAVLKLLTLRSRGVIRIEPKYPTIANWESVPTIKTAIAKFKRLQIALENHEEKKWVDNCHVHRNDDDDRIYITGPGKKFFVIQKNEFGALLIEYNRTTDKVPGKCLHYFQLRKENGKTYLVTPKDDDSLKEYINKIKFGKAKRYWER